MSTFDRVLYRSASFTGTNQFKSPQNANTMTTTMDAAATISISSLQEKVPVDNNNDSSVEQTTSSPAPPRDDEDLLLEYDVILCGTGLVQSILASALARVGKSVLHCDAQGHYGELDTVWNLPFLQEQLKENMNQQQQQLQEMTDTDQQAAITATVEEALQSIRLYPHGAIQSLHFFSSHTRTTFPIKVGTKVATPYGPGTITEMPVAASSSSPSTSKVSVTLSNWTLANGKSSVVHFGIPSDRMNNVESYLAETQDVLPIRTLEAQTILQQKSRSFALDVTPSLVYASGSAVQGMLVSSVAEYLDFKSIDALLWFDPATATTTQHLSRVPCSKGDVFTSQLLPPLDKRKLMKFLQLTLDYATAVQMAQEEASVLASSAATTTTSDADDASTEHGDGSEPMDPMLAAAAVNQSHVQSLNERQLNQGRSLARPQNKSVSTDEFQELQRCITENMDFDQYLAEKQRLSPGLRTLIRYALVLESGTGQSTTLEGMTKLCRHMQALGRYGSTAFLFPLYGSGELPQAFCRSAAVHGATYLLRRAPLQISISDETVQGVVVGGDKSSEDNPSFAVGCREEKLIRCRQVIVPQGAIQGEDAAESQRILRRISIFRGKLILSDNGDQRHVVIIPPGAVNSNEFAIHAVALDHTVCVAPQVPCGCTVLHLSTMIASDSNLNIQRTILDKAAELLVATAATTTNPADELVDEIFHVTFAYDLRVPTGKFSSVKGLHISHLSRQGLAVDDAFDQAKAIFTSICPGQEFLAMSTEMDKVVKERFPDHGNEEDDEGLVLRSAVNMLTPPQEDTKE